MIRVVVAEDHPIARMGFAQLLARPGMRVVAEVDTGAAAIDAYRRLRPTVLVLDLKLPDMDGPEVVRRLLGEHPGARVLVVTAHDRGEQVRRVLDAGAAGFVSKTTASRDVVAAVLEVARGGRVVPEGAERALAEARSVRPLSARERQVLALVVEGRTNREIGVALGVSETTVRTHVLHLFAKLGVADRTEAATVALRLGLVQ